MKFAFFLLIATHLLGHQVVLAENTGTRGGGEIVGSNLRDLVDPTTCDLYTAEDFINKYSPKTWTIINRLKKYDWLTAALYKDEIKSLKVCLTKGRLKQVKTNDDASVMIHEVDSKLVGLRVDDNIYINKDYFLRTLRKNHRPYFILHEVTHSFVFHADKERNAKIRNIVRKIEEVTSDNFKDDNDGFSVYKSLHANLLFNSFTGLVKSDEEILRKRYERSDLYSIVDKYSFSSDQERFNFFLNNFSDIDQFIKLDIYKDVYFIQYDKYRNLKTPLLQMGWLEYRKTVMGNIIYESVKNDSVDKMIWLEQQIGAEALRNYILENSEIIGYGRDAKFKGLFLLVNVYKSNRFIDFLSDHLQIDFDTLYNLEKFKFIEPRKEDVLSRQFSNEFRRLKNLGLANTIEFTSTDMYIQFLTDSYPSYRQFDLYAKKLLQDKINTLGEAYLNSTIDDNINLKVKGLVDDSQYGMEKFRLVLILPHVAHTPAFLTALHNATDILDYVFDKGLSDLSILKSYILYDGHSELVEEMSESNDKFKLKKLCQGEDSIYRYKYLGPIAISKKLIKMPRSKKPECAWLRSMEKKYGHLGGFVMFTESMKTLMDYAQEKNYHKLVKTLKKVGVKSRRELINND